MKDRIKQLKIQACKWASENASSTEYENAADQKFAELIVRECMNVAGANYMSTPEDCVYYVDLAVERIAEHFGVE